MPTRQRISFDNGAGVELAAALELPDRTPRAFALFAHCFTCGKDNAAAARIARTLAMRDIAVLRFDFTGLGGSGGDFGNAGFSASVEDILAAAGYLRREHRAPALLIGHSLGGTAVLAAAAGVPESTAVATIAAPASPAHVLRRLGVDAERIRREGRADVSLGGRTFTISRAFLEDLEARPLTDEVAALKRALLVFHAPFDDVVSIDEATRIFTAARHPKSFVSIDGADHLLSDLTDAQYVANTIAAWAARYVDSGEDEAVQARAGEVLVGEGNHRFLRDVASDDHAWLADEPQRAGGDNLGPDPYEHLLAALGTCTSMTVRMYANRKRLPLDNVVVRLEHSREHAEDCENCEDPAAGMEVMHRYVRIEGDLDEGARKRLLEIADRCPVHRTLTGDLRIETEVE